MTIRQVVHLLFTVTTESGNMRETKNEQKPNKATTKKPRIKPRMTYKPRVSGFYTTLALLGQSKAGE